MSHWLLMRINVPVRIRSMTRTGHCFVPSDLGRKLRIPWSDFFGLAMRTTQKGIFLPISGPFNVDVHGTEGHAYAWDNGDIFCVRRSAKGGAAVEEQVIKPTG